jgi:hypothetical protein
MGMQAEERAARQRLSVLQLAEVLDNVSAACRQRGMARVHDELRWVARDALAAYELAPADNPIVDALLANT